MTTAMRARRERMPTGVPGLDEIMDGGLAEQAVTVLLGGTGTGKTTFGMQMLACGARANEAGIAVAFEESADRLLANASTYSWGTDIVGGLVHVVDAQLAQSVEQGGEFDLVGLLGVLSAKIERVDARRVLFDGLDVVLGYLGRPALIRREVFRLRDWVHTTGVTAMVTAKGNVDSRLSADYDFLQFMADCLVTLHHRIVQGTALRTIRVNKYRGAEHSSNELPLTIGHDGPEVAALRSRPHRSRETSPRSGST